MHEADPFAYLTRADILLPFVAGTIDLADDEGEGEWGATEYEDGLRINVGWTEIITVTEDEVRAIVHGPTVKRTRLDPAVRIRGGPRRGPVYPTIPESVCVTIPTSPASVLRRTLGRIVPALRIAIRCAAIHGMGRGVVEGHSTDLVERLAHAVGRPLPQPFYAATRTRRVAVRPVHVLQAVRQREVLIRRGVAEGKVGPWTVPKSARRGDHAVFYVTSPRCAFIATGTIAQDAERYENKGSEWDGRFFAPVTSLRLVEPEVDLDTARKALPEWPYLRNLRGMITATDKPAAKLTRLLACPPSGRERAESSIEGRVAEYRVLSRSRCQRLRESALRMSGGACVACQTNFVEMLGQFGWSALQVHHTKQLAGRAAPTPTRLDELAVLCATCHALVHADKQRLISVDDLRALLETRS